MFPLYCMINFLASCDEGDIKLAAFFGNQRMGVVLLCKNGEWGVLCGQVWTELEASITCRQLGYSYQGIKQAHVACNSKCFCL